MSFKAAAIQMRSGVDPVRNAADMERLVRAAVAEGAVYVQTPEMTGAIQKDRQALRAQLRDDDGDIIVATAARLARELGIHVHVGSTAIARPDGREPHARPTAQVTGASAVAPARLPCSSSTPRTVTARC